MTAENCVAGNSPIGRPWYRERTRVLSDNVLVHLADVFAELEAPPTRRVPDRDASDFDVKTEVGISLDMPPIGGRFKVLAPLASGAMGSVFRAADLETGREVAVKVPHLLGSAIDRRFEVEVDAIAAVLCPATVGFVARGDADEPFVAMELVRGSSLGKRLSATGAMPAPKAVAVARRLAAALAAVHLSGWVHRDVKPGNVILTDDGCVRLVDFGLARALEGPGAGTETGQILGTLGYLAPEQFAPKRVVDPRTDVFALGCVLFECLTGRNAWQRSISDVFAGKWVPERHPRLDVRGHVRDAEVAAVVEALVENDPTRRPEDGLAALEVVLGLDAHARAILAPTWSSRAIVREAVKGSLRGPLALTGDVGVGKSSVATTAALLLSEMLAPASVVLARCNPRTSRIDGGHALLLERMLRAAGYTSAARVLSGQGVSVGARAQDPSLVIVLDDVSFADEQSVRWARALASVGLARVIATVRPGAPVPADFEELRLSGAARPAAPDIDELPAKHRRTLRAFAAIGMSFDVAFASQLAVEVGASMAPELLHELCERRILTPVGRDGYVFARASYWEHLLRRTDPDERRDLAQRADQIEATSGRVPVEVSVVARTTASYE
jgi:hypothetical protein